MATDLIRLYEKIRPKLDALEERRKSLRMVVVGGIVTAALGVGSGIVAFVGPPETDAAWARFVPAGATVLAFYFFATAFKRFLMPGMAAFQNYKARFKADIVTELVKAIQPGAKYYPERYLRREAYDRCRLFRRDLKGYTGDDLLQGAIGDTPYECSEVRAQIEIVTRDSDGDTSKRTEDVFHGLLARVDFDAALQGHTIVETEQNKEAPRERLDRVAIDAAFDARFTVTSNKPDEAKEILGRVVRTGLLSLADQVGAPLHVAFCDRSVYVAINYKRALLEPKIATSLSAQDLAPFVAPIDLADDIVRAFGLATSRRLPPDPDFHRGGFTIHGREALAKRVLAGKGDVEFDEIVDAADDARAAKEAPIEPPPHPYATIEDDGTSLRIGYGFTCGTLVVLLVVLAVSPVLAVAAWNWFDPSAAEQLIAFAEPRSWRLKAAFEDLLPFPTVLFFGILVFWWFWWASLRHRPVSLVVSADGVRVRNLFSITSIVVPIEAIKTVKGENQRVYVMRNDRAFLSSYLTASPLVADIEGRFLALQIRNALKRHGWRPVA